MRTQVCMSFTERKLFQTFYQLPQDIFMSSCATTRVKQVGLQKVKNRFDSSKGYLLGTTQWVVPTHSFTHPRLFSFFAQPYCQIKTATQYPYYTANVTESSSTQLTQIRSTDAPFCQSLPTSPGVFVRSSCSLP